MAQEDTTLNDSKGMWNELLAVDVTLSPIDFDDEFPKRVIKFTKAHRIVQVGRSSKNDTKNLIGRVDNAYFDSPVMSRRHAELLFENGIWVVDKESTHGTLLNHDRLIQRVPAKVRDDDVLTFGCQVVRGEETFPARSFRLSMQSHLAPASPISSTAAKATTPTSTFNVPEETTSDEECNAHSERHRSMMVPHESDESDEESVDASGDRPVMPVAVLDMIDDSPPSMSPGLVVSDTGSRWPLECVSTAVGIPNASTNGFVRRLVAQQDTPMDADTPEPEEDQISDRESPRFLKDDGDSDGGNQSVSDHDGDSEHHSLNVSEEEPERSPKAYNVLDLTTEDEAMSSSESSRASSVEEEDEEDDDDDDDAEEEDEEEDDDDDDEESLFVPMSPVKPGASQIKGEEPPTAAPANQPLAVNRAGDGRFDGSRDHPLVIADDEHDMSTTPGVPRREQDQMEKNPALSISHVLQPADERQQPPSAPAPRPAEPFMGRVPATPTFAPSLRHGRWWPAVPYTSNAYEQPSRSRLEAARRLPPPPRPPYSSDPPWRLFPNPFASASQHVQLSGAMPRPCNRMMFEGQVKALSQHPPPWMHPCALTPAPHAPTRRLDDRASSSLPRPSMPASMSNPLPPNINRMTAEELKQHLARLKPSIDTLMGRKGDAPGRGAFSGMHGTARDRLVMPSLDQGIHGPIPAPDHPMGARAQLLRPQRQTPLAMGLGNLAVNHEGPRSSKSNESEREGGGKKLPDVTSTEHGKETAASNVGAEPSTPISHTRPGAIDLWSSDEQPVRMSLKRKAEDEAEKAGSSQKDGANQMTSIHSAMDDERAKNLPHFSFTGPEPSTNSDIADPSHPIRRTTADVHTEMLSEVPPPRKRVKSSDDWSGGLAHVKSAARMFAGAAIAGVTVFAYLAGSNPDPI
ncbi:MAG: hypothetical protein M1823_005977 [Watsoniomyces obsoletus]|nr:MAG: hypothetical protein M1823_005977 [Watsoniomyces obsoletus]